MSPDMSINLLSLVLAFLAGMLITVGLDRKP